MSILSVQCVGLILCILGAAIIMRGFAFATFAGVTVKSSGKVETAQSLLHVLCAQRMDARLGAPLLMAGFGMQLLASLGVTEKPVVMFLVLAAVAVAILYYSLMRDLIATTAISAIMTEREAVRDTRRMIESKFEAPIPAAAHLHIVETMAGA